MTQTTDGLFRDGKTSEDASVSEAACQMWRTPCGYDAMRWDVIPSACLRSPQWRNSYFVASCAVYANIRICTVNIKREYQYQATYQSPVVNFSRLWNLTYTVYKWHDATFCLCHQSQVAVRLFDSNIFTLSYRKNAPKCVNISDWRLNFS